MEPQMNADKHSFSPLCHSERSEESLSSGFGGAGVGAKVVPADSVDGTTEMLRQAQHNKGAESESTPVHARFSELLFAGFGLWSFGFGERV
jgi:hypothetical protein